MQDITELQRRLTVALDRIGGGLDRLGRAEDRVAEPSVDVPGLMAELEAERARTAQLQDELGATAVPGDGDRTARLEEEIARSRAALAAMEEDRTRLKAANDALSRSNQMLQEATSEGLSDPGLVDAAMRSELDALRAARQSDRAELDAIVALLKPVLETNEEAGEDA